MNRWLRAGALLLGLGVLAEAGAPQAATWGGYVDQSAPLRTDTYSFGGANPAAIGNENYYDGDFGDFDNDGQPDRALGARYGLLKNMNGGLMTPYAGSTGFLFRGLTSATNGWGEDGFQWADVDNDGDLDCISGGSYDGEPAVCQINQAGKFFTKWTKQLGANSIVSTDIERDGDVDLLFSVDVQVRLLVNDGAGNYTEEAGSRGLGSAVLGFDIAGYISGDLDGDGDFDLILAEAWSGAPNGGPTRFWVALNDGTGHFTPRVLEFATPVRTGRIQIQSFNQHLGLGDIDGDGDLDFVAFLGPNLSSSSPKVTHAIFINNGAGQFVEESAARFHVGSYLGAISGTNGKIVDVDYDGDLDLVSAAKDALTNSDAVYILLNDGTGHFTYDPVHSISGFPIPTSGIFRDIDVTDIDGDGTYDLWHGRGGTAVHILINTYRDPSGLPADVPRNLTVVSAGTGGVTLSWKAPPFAANARWYKVFRTTTPRVDWKDRPLLKRVTLSRHQDEAFVAPITRHTTTAYLNDPDVTLIGSNNEVRFIDRTAKPGVTYYYTVTHVGTENTESRPGAEVSATIAPVGGADTAPPDLSILSPTAQDWGAFPRIVLHYGDGGTGIDPTTLSVSFDRPLGTGSVATGGRPAGANVSDLFHRKDAGAYIAALGPSLSLPANLVATLTARVSDRAGNSTTQQVSFFVSVTSSVPPTAVMSANPTTGGAPLTVNFSSAGSADSNGKLFATEWFFGDGGTALGPTAIHTYTAAGTYLATLRVKDNEGGVAVATQTITVTTGTPLSVVTVTATDPSASEAGPNAGTFTISRTGSTTAALTVAYTLGGTAANGTDYSSLAGSVTIPAGAASATVTVSPVNDTAVEVIEAVNLTLSTSATYSVGAASNATVTIADDDAATTLPVVTLGVFDGPASEPGADTGLFQAARTGNPTAPLTVFYTIGGTATTGSDYATLSGSVVIPAGLFNAPITIVPLDDLAVEGSETVVLTLAAHAAYTIGTQMGGTVTIADNDTSGLPVVNVSSPDAAASEPGTDTGSFTITRGGSTAAALTVHFAVSGTAAAGSDYAALGTSVIIPAGSGSATLTVAPTDDMTVESAETVILTLSANSAYTLGTPSNATVTIADNDTATALPVVTVAVTDASAAEPGTDTGSFTVTRTGSTSSPLTVTFGTSGTATSGTDYIALAGSVTVAAGSATATVTLTPKDDTAVEGSETVILTLSASPNYTVGAPSNATVTIGDNDSAPPPTPAVTITSADPNASEPSDPGTFTVTRTGSTASALIVNFGIGGTAGNGTDYTALGTSVTIASGAAFATVAVSPKDDALVESAETVTLTVVIGSGYTVGTPAAATVTIADNDTPASAPTGLATMAQDSRVTLAWKPVAGASAYNLYMAEVSGVTRANYSALAGGMAHPGVASPFVHLGLTNGVRYYFVVTAVKAGVESPESLEVSAVPSASVWPVPDGDQDGHSDAAEVLAGSNPAGGTSRPGDTDQDGLGDAWETAQLGGLSQDAAGDPDGDGLVNLVEYNAGTNPNQADTDGDGYTDFDEYQNGSSPLDPASVPGGGGGGGGGGSEGCGAIGGEFLVLWALLCATRVRRRARY